MLRPRRRQHRRGRRRHKPAGCHLRRRRRRRLLLLRRRRRQRVEKRGRIIHGRLRRWRSRLKRRHWKQLRRRRRAAGAPLLGAGCTRHRHGSRLCRGGLAARRGRPMRFRHRQRRRVGCCGRVRRELRLHAVEGELSRRWPPLERRHLRGGVSIFRRGSNGGRAWAYPRKGRTCAPRSSGRRSSSSALRSCVRAASAAAHAQRRQRWETRPSGFTLPLL